MDAIPVVGSSVELHDLLNEPGRLLIYEHAGSGTVLEFVGAETGPEELGPEEFNVIASVPAPILKSWWNEAPRGRVRRDFDGPLAMSRYILGYDTWRERPCAALRPLRVGTVGGINAMLLGKPVLLAACLNAAAEIWEYVGKPWTGATPSYGAWRQVAWVGEEALSDWLRFSEEQAGILGPRWSNGPFAGTWTGGLQQRPWGKDAEAVAAASIMVWAPHQVILSSELRSAGSLLVPHPEGGAVLWQFKPKGRRRNCHLFAPVVVAPDEVYRDWRRSAEGMGACYGGVDGFAEGWFFPGNDTWRTPPKGRRVAQPSSPMLVPSLQGLQTQLAVRGRCVTEEKDGSGRLWEYTGAPWRPDDDSLIAFRLIGVVLQEAMTRWRETARSVAPKSLTTGPVADSWAVAGMASWLPAAPDVAARARLQWIETLPELDARIRRPGCLVQEVDGGGAVLWAYEGQVPLEGELQRGDFWARSAVSSTAMQAWLQAHPKRSDRVAGPLPGTWHLASCNVWTLLEGMKLSSSGDFFIDLEAGTMTWRISGETAAIEAVYHPAGYDGAIWLNLDHIRNRALQVLTMLRPNGYPVPEPPPTPPPPDAAAAN